MQYSPQNINRFNFFNLPSAWWSGVRVVSLDKKKCVVEVKHGWFNKNPFRSMFWAVQGMAAELTTGAPLMKSITESGQQISMLLIATKSTFSKKAVGRIQFACHQVEQAREAVDKVCKTPEEAAIIQLHSRGVNEQGDAVSSFDFSWSMKVKNAG